MLSQFVPINFYINASENEKTASGAGGRDLIRKRQHDKRTKKKLSTITLYYSTKRLMFNQ